MPSIKIHAAGPTVVVTGGPGTYTNSSVVWARTGQLLTVTFTDSVSGVGCADLWADAAHGTLIAQINGAGPTYTFSNVQVGSGALAGKSDGTVNLYLTSGSKTVGGGRCKTDLNSAQGSFIQDNTAPTISAAPSITPTPNNGWNTSTAIVKLSPTDGAGSGVASTTYIVNYSGGGAPVTGAYTSAGISVGGKGDGVYTVQYTITDNVGATASPAPVTIQVDATKPTISAAQSPAPNTKGWNNGNVTVTFTCADVTSGMASCTVPQTLSSEGANLQVTGTATDHAGNTQTTTYGPVKIDKTAPTLTGAPTTSPNGNLWYNTPVTIAWTCSDALSGIPTSACPANSTLSSEGSAVTTSASVSDNAGNITTATSAPVKIDLTAPTTSATAPNGWQNGNVTVVLSPSDNGSGVFATYYTIDGSAQQSGTNVTFSAEGDHTLQYWSVDNAGNSEATNTIHVKIDKTPPTLIPGQTPPANASHWNNTDVTVTFTCADSLSGVAACPASQTVTTEGQSQSVSGTATDNAGNSTTANYNVNIDKTPPTISAATDRPANTNGWYNAPVTVSFSCFDALSGLSGSCPASQQVNEGGNQTVSGTVSDAAGNTARASVSPINVDTTAPTVTGAATTSPNANGWYNGNVTIAWTCADALSGLDGACPADSVITSEGASTGASASVMDKAGNTGAGSVSGIQIDRTAPSTIATNPPTGWNRSDTTISLSANDNLSGVAATYYQIDGGAPQTGTTVLLNTDGTHTLTFWSVDKAGNVEDKTALGNTITVEVDKTAPTIAGAASPTPNGFGWNNSDVTVNFTCADATSGVAFCTAPTTVSTDGSGQTVTGTATDVAGNTSSTTVGNINLDKTAPALTSAPTTAPNAKGWYRGDVVIHWTASDALSGTNPATVPSDATLTGEGVNLTATASVSDYAGNSTTATSAPVKVDRTAPQLLGSPTTTVSGTDASGGTWYKGDVTIAWTCADPALTDAASSAGSGVASCPANSVISGEGTGLTANGEATDNAGNVATNASDAVNIDRTAPNTDVTAPTTWTNTNVTVTLAGHDALSGVKNTYYILDGAAQQTYADGIAITTEGTHTLSYWSEDYAGNVEAKHTVQVMIDKTAPTISHRQAPTANPAGWNNSDVTVTFTCDDALSGVASCTTPQTVTTEGHLQTILGTATDNAGNTATDTATVSIDKTAPTISGAAKTPANSNHWYNSPVTITWTCADTTGGSGIAFCQPDSVISTEGAGVTTPGTATDAADNSTTVNSPPINLDMTLPTITGAPTAPANAHGWYNTDVSIAWTCGDTLSGIDGSCPANTVIKGEGASLSASASVSDKAGNVGSGTVEGIKIDRTAPQTTWSAQADYTTSAGVLYYGSAFNVALSPTDSGSGVDQTYYTLDGGAQQTGQSVDISGEGTHTLVFWSVDNAGNVEAHHTQSYLIDTTAPIISSTRTPANAAGWNNNDVAVAFTCVDPALADGKPGSGVHTCDGATTLSSDGAGQSVTGTSSDNVRNLSSLTVGGINIDKTPPTITGGPDRAANARNWYNADVSVSFQCGDNLSGIASCAVSSPAPTGTPAASITLGEGKNQSVTGTAVDVAGNSTDLSVTGINIDKTAPTLSGAATTAPNGNGWYNGDVQVNWACSDALSGIDGACPASSTITSEGKNLGVQATVSDLAGNPTTAAVNGINIDRSAPATSISAPNDWSNSAVTVTLTATDNLSGVATTFYTINGGGAQPGDSFSLTTDGIYTIQYWSMDNAGNSEQTHTAVVKIDRTAPTITHQQAPSANLAGWNNSDVTVTFTCADNLSGVKSCDGAASTTGATTVSTEGQGQTVVAQAVDNANNTASDTATVSIDKTPPTISITPDRTPNANSWYNAKVVVTVACSDGLSGIQSCPASQTLGEGGSQTVSGTAVDAAGNTASATLSGINIDTTKPTLTGAATTSPNANGWYNGNVTVQWSCSDALSGLAAPCPSDTTLSSEGSGVRADATISDLAGNTSSASVSVNIDRTAPTTTASYPSGIYQSWYNGPVTINLSASDNLSGVATTYYSVDGGAAQAGTALTVKDNGKHTVTYWSVDNAGNEETHSSAAIWVDTTPPTITKSVAPASPDGQNGWYVSPVTVTFNCADADSGIKACLANQSASGQQTLSTDGANQTVTGQATDNVGNTASASVTVNIDQTSPSMTVSVGGATYNDGGAIHSVTTTHTIANPYTLGGAPKVACAATDATSGLAALCAGVVTGGTSNGVGFFTYTATATDRAGNTTRVIVNYQVVYTFSGFLQPVNYTAHQLGASGSIFKAGSTIPFKFQLHAADGSLVQPGSAPQWIDVVAAGPTTGSPSASAASAPVTTTNGATFTGDASQQQYNWSTKGFAPGTWYRVGVKLDDGQVYMVYINLR